MPRVIIPVQQAPLAGLVIAGAGVSEVTADPVNNHYYANGARTALIVRNPDASDHYVEIEYAESEATVTPLNVLVAAGQTVVVPALPPSRFSQIPAASRRQVFVNPSSAQLALQAVSI